MIAIPQQSRDQSIRPFVFGGAKASENIRNKNYPIILVRLIALSPNIEHVVCDSFDRELIYRLKRLGLNVEEYPMFNHDFATGMMAMQNLLMPNMYFVFGTDLIQHQIIHRLCQYRNIPLLAGL